MSERVRLVNQQLAFSQSHLQAANLSEGFMRRCQLQACKLQMYLMIHAYLAEIAERSNLKWELFLGDLNHALDQFSAQLQQQDKVSSDFYHLVELIREHAPWPHWVELAKSALFIGKTELNSPVLAESAPNNTATSASMIASSNQTQSFVTTHAEAQILILQQMLAAFTDLLHVQRENKIEF
jgi:hypothetical protein